MGTTYAFALNTNATVRLTFMENVRGRRVRGNCRAVTGANRRDPSCGRATEIGVLTTHLRAGRDQVRFRGRLGRRAGLPLGSYTVLITATNAGGRSVPHRLRFTIVG
jgi:hypothetical protein